MERHMGAKDDQQILAVHLQTWYVAAEEYQIGFLKVLVTYGCLYISDAADAHLRMDLGGRARSIGVNDTQHTLADLLHTPHGD